MIAVLPCVALLYMHLHAVRIAIHVQPTAVIYSRRFDNKGVSIPVANGISIPARVRSAGLADVRRKLAAIGPNLAPNGLILKKLNGFGGSLHEFHVPDFIEQIPRKPQRIALD